MLGLSVGLTDEEIVGMADPARCSTFDETDRLVLGYAESLATQNQIDEALFAALAARFSRQEFIELCLAAAMAGMVNRVHATFHTDVDEATKVFLKDRAPSDS